MMNIIPSRRRKSAATKAAALTEQPTTVPSAQITAPTSTNKPPRDCHKHASSLSRPPEGFDLPPRGSLNRDKIVYLNWRLNIIYDARRPEYEEEDRRRSRSNSSSSGSSASSSSFATPSTARSSQSQQRRPQLPVIIHPDDVQAIAAAAGASPSPPVIKRPLISSHYASQKIPARTALSTTLRLTDDEIDDKFAFFSMPILSLNPISDAGSIQRAVLAAGQQDSSDDVEVLREEDESEDDQDDDIESLSSSTSSSDPSTASGGGGDDDADSLPSKATASQDTMRRRRAKRFLSLIGLRAEAATAGTKPTKVSPPPRKTDEKIVADESLAELRFQAGMWF